MDKSAKVFRDTVLMASPECTTTHMISMKISGLINLELLKKLNVLAETQQNLFASIDITQRGYITATEVSSQR